MNLPTTGALVDRLGSDSTLRRICGFERKRDIPSESTFSRAFAEFAETELGQRTHTRLVEELYGEEMVGHISRDSTAIEAREKPMKKAVAEEPETPRRSPRVLRSRATPRPAFKT
jgi:hypothetical protein